MRSLAVCFNGRGRIDGGCFAGFTDNISEWMEASDLLVTKAGPGTIAEAFVKSLPMIIYTYLPGQEEGNMQFVVDNDLGIYSTDAEVIGATASEWLGDPERLAEVSAMILQPYPLAA